jgi:phosphatidate cytidylyltransferase
VTALYFLAVADYKERTKWIVFGLPYIASFALALLSLRATPDTGMVLVFYLLAVVWGADIGGYIAGRLIGGPKLAPAISPNKTWAGFFGGIVLATVCGGSVMLAFGARNAWAGLLLAFGLAVVSQLGDLFESWVKRRADVRQSSNLIPGHGGVLDRIDGLIVATLAFAVFQTLFGARMDWW